MSKKKKLKKQNKELSAIYTEVCEAANDAITPNRILTEEVEYLTDYIRWKSLTEEYQYFKENAHRESNTELPFPHLIM